MIIGVLWKAIRSVLPLIIVGSFRIIAVKGTNYQEHVTEYGVHWNFFFTLAAISIFVTVCFSFLPPSTVLPVACSIISGDYIPQTYWVTAGSICALKESPFIIWFCRVRNLAWILWLWRIHSRWRKERLEFLPQFEQRRNFQFNWLHCSVSLWCSLTLNTLTTTRATT